MNATRDKRDDLISHGLINDKNRLNRGGTQSATTNNIRGNQNPGTKTRKKSKPPSKHTVKAIGILHRILNKQTQ